jgi:hypothetical protein
MADSSFPLRAFLVLDNCVLVMLTDYFCARRALRLPIRGRVPSLQLWIAERLDGLRPFTPDGLLHCTDCVASEFNPRAGQISQWRGVGHRDYKSLENHVCSQLHQAGMSTQDVEFLRNLPTAPRKLVGPDGLSDGDFSLVALGAQLAAQGERVYVLTKDQDLLAFISWVRTKREARERWQNVHLLQGLHCLTYLELAHRACDIPTELMKDLIDFALADHFDRKDLAGTQKGKSIVQTLLQVNGSIMESIAIKQSAQGAVL